ncbi:MAG: ABC transporter ATP-binding protein, partial [Clostridia bacterium]|nr:ABC transporter ATP-binding protein [Clostridia bacterium]
MRKIFRNFRWYDYILILVIFGLIVLQVSFEMQLIKLMEELLAKVQALLPIGEIWKTGSKMLLTCLGILGSCAISSCISAVLAAKFAQRLRSQIFKTVNGFSQEEINRFSTPSLITRSTNDVTQVQNTLQMCLRMAMMAPTMATFSIVNIVNSSAELSWATAGAVLLMFTLFIILSSVVVPRFSKIQKQIDKLNLVARESLTGVRVIRAYNTEKEQEGKFETSNEDITKSYIFVGNAFSLMNPFMNLIFNGLSLLIFWLGSYLVNTNGIAYTQLFQFSQYGTHILMSFMFLSMIVIMLPRGIVSLKRIAEVINTKTKIVEGNFDAETEVKGKLEFRNVSFRYPDAEMNVLENINFTVEKGQTIAFIGSTGSGKSTLVNLIPRFFDTTFGEVLIDDINIKEYTTKALNKKLGFVPQKGVLFRGTVEENVKYGAPDATAEKVNESLKVAQANFVEKLEG